MPLLQQRWPHFAEATARSAALCAEQESLLDELLADDLAHCQTQQGTLKIAPMLAMSDAVARRLSAAGWQGRMHLCLPARRWCGSGRKWRWRGKMLPPCLRLGAFEIRRYQSQLWWIKSVAGQSETIVPWQTWLQPLELPAGLGSVQLTAGGDIRPPRADEAVSVRFKAPGLLHIVGRNGGRKLKKIWQELGVPPWLRDTTPLLFYGETLIAAAGVFVTQEGVAVGENGVSFVWQKTLSQVKAG